jgi:hypothetical protein
MKNFTALSVGLFTLGLLVPTFSNADSGASMGPHHGEGKAKLQACVTANGGGTLPDLTPEQRKAAWSCHKDNKGDPAGMKACADKAGIPPLDDKTEAALKKCHPHGGPHHHGGSSGAEPSST